MKLWITEDIEDQKSLSPYLTLFDEDTEEPDEEDVRFGLAIRTRKS